MLIDAATSNDARDYEKEEAQSTWAVAKRCDDIVHGRPEPRKDELGF